ncbi:MAG TPA: hypothetical protein VMV04_11925 [Thermodesulfobacteriota bacterium]|jgi:predicted membrane metal-binding protein|nr:hypothetical protein [Thermodesulfobacteriota bacterium]
MSRVILALLVLAFCLILLLFIWIIFLTLAVLLFSERRKKGIRPLPETKGDEAGG